MQADPRWPSFEPHPLLRTAHVMTLASLMPRWVFDAEVELPEGERRLFGVGEDTQLLGWLHRRDGVEDAPLVLLAHGHAGDADSHYMVGTAAKALDAGCDVLRLNARNRGRCEGLTPTLFSPLQTGDVLAAARELVAGRDDARVYLVGFSMGGNMLLKLAGELADDAPPWLRGVVAISPPVDLASGREALDEVPLNRVYREYFLRDMRKMVERKAEHFPGAFDTEGLADIRTVREWDERVTAPHFGFGSALEYYRAASSRPLLGRIRVPTLIVHAHDDPIVPFAPLADPAVLDDASTTLLAPEFGGHCAFIAREAEERGDRFWAENRALDFVRALEDAR